MAASNYALIVEIKTMVKCAVCLHQFDDPRSLPCQHTFCKKCLEVLRGNTNKIQCPCCQKVAPVPNGVWELPVDVKANSWLEIMSEYKKAEAAKAAVAEVQAAQCPSHRTDQTCLICGNVRTIFKRLSCGHRLCGNCVEFLLPVGGDTLHCPIATCSRETVILPQLLGNPGTSSQANQPGTSFGDHTLSQMLSRLENQAVPRRPLSGPQASRVPAPRAWQVSRFTGSGGQMSRGSPYRRPPPSS